MKYQRSIYIFHRSLRLDDNLGLIKALKESDAVIPVFCFTPEQIGGTNKFRSINAISFMIDALEDLDRYLRKKSSKMFYFYGKQHVALDEILKNRPDIEAVYVNEEYTKYGVWREKKLRQTCSQNNVDFFSVHDYLLLEKNTALTGSGTFYSKFTPFYNNIINYDVPGPKKNNHTNYISSRYSISNSIKLKEIRSKYIDQRKEIMYSDIFPATRKEGLQRIRDIRNFENYEDTRNDLSTNTTKLSPYIKFGIISVREVYDKIKKLFGKKHGLIKQLYWREFYYNIASNRPDIFSGKSFKPKYDRIVWPYDNKLFKKWKTGQTGFPIVDAGMRELNETGYMHNRARLITSNFLIKLLFIDWRKGEMYYSQKLFDYDPSVNNGNWQWGAGSGADSQPYFRIFNPWTQGKNYDPDCQYIRKWIPELADVPDSDILDWSERYRDHKDTDYPAPCISYEKARGKIKKIYSRIY